MKKRYKVIFFLSIFLGMLFILSRTNNIKAATYGHYTYEEKDDGTIRITKYDGTAANNIDIPSTINGKKVTSIGRYAFSGCSGLTGNLVIPDSVISIDWDAFKGCSGLTGNLIIGNSVTSIGNFAFFGCSGFTGNLVIPDSVISIDWGAFKGCSSFTGNLVIPDSVTSIGPDAFEECSGFTGDLVIPDSVTSIDSDAFYGCSGFTGSLTIGNGVTSIGKSAFYGCSGFTGELVIPDSVTSIGKSAFYDCSGFTGSLTIGNGVTSIGDFAFSGCSRINGFVVSDNNENYSDKDGILYDKNLTTIIKCPSAKSGNIEIPTSVTSIVDSAFYNCSGLTGDLIIPDSVTSIGNCAFQNCRGFTGNLKIGNGVTNIGESVFHDCSGFTGDLVIPNSVMSIGQYAFQSCRGFSGTLTLSDSVTSIGESAFSYCSGFTGNLIIPDSVTSIEGWAFSGCAGFTGNLVIPDSVTEIGYSAFSNCSGLTGNLVIPDSVTTIGGYAFFRCRGFTGNLAISNNITSIETGAFGGCSGFTGNLVIPNSVTSIGECAFDGCSGFTGSLTIGNSVTSIGKYSFRECGSFKGNLVIPGSVTSIGSSAFYNCSGFNGNLVISDGVTNIDKYTFEGCSGFTGNLVIPDSVTSIDESAFKGCSKLAGNLVIPDSVTSIGESAFYGCSGFTGDLVIPDSITSIGVAAFRGCSGFTGNLVIPDSVTTIEENAFRGCSGFTGNLVIPDSVTSIEEEAFTGCKGFTGNLVIPDSVTSIGEWAFGGCSGFTGDLVIPDSVTSIGRSAFSDCSGFTGTLKLSNNLTNIESYTFSQCRGFTGDLVIPDGVKTISSNAFNWCEGFNGKLIIGNGVTDIEKDAFYLCYGLTGEIILGTSLLNIGEYAFQLGGVTGNVVIPDSVKKIDAHAFSYNNDLDNFIFIGDAPLIGIYHHPNISTDDPFPGGQTKLYYRKGTTGYTAENNWPVDRLVEYTEALKKTKYIVNDVSLGANRTKIELDSTLSPLVTATYDVADPSVATISKSGNVGYINPVNNGTTQVTVNLKYSDSVVRKLYATVTVDIKATNISLNKNEYVFSNGQSGQTLNLNATVLPEKTNNKTVRWTSSNTNVATVDDTGKVTTVASGECNITATTTDGSNLSDTCKIIVPKMVNSITLNKSSYTIQNNYIPITIIATVSPNDAYNKSIKWTSNDPSVAYVEVIENTGTLHAKLYQGTKSGRCTITAEALDGSGVKGTCEVEVNIPPTEVKLDKTEFSFLNIGDRLKLNATITPSNAYQTVIWESSNTNIATVDENGNVTPVSNGECKITARSKENNNLSAECDITVNLPQIIQVTKITLNKTSHTFTSNTTLQLEATIEPSNATNKEITWQSSNTNIATVDNTGKVTPKSNGECRITATAKDGSGVKATCDITVNIPVKVTKITLNKTSHTFTKNIPLQLEATIEPSNATNKEITWESSDTNIAIVDNTGKVKPKSNGECKITATAKDGSGIKATCDVEVNKPQIIPVTNIYFTQDKVTITSPGFTPSYSPVIEPSNASNKNIIWTSSDESIATVDRAGVIKGVSNGTCNIIATTNDGTNLSASIEVTVSFPVKVTKITLNKTSHTFTKNIALQLEATIEPSNATNKEITWESSDPYIATVDENGKVRPKSNGSCRITATAKDGSGVKATCDVEVNMPQMIPVTNIYFTQDKVTITSPGFTPSYNPVIEPSNASNQSVIWTSSDESVATVDRAGVIKGISNGTCKITATTNDGTNLSASIDVTVSLPIKVTKLSINYPGSYVSFSKLNGTYTLKTIIEPESATNKELEWTSSDPSVATVDNTGKVTALKNGVCNITATTKDGSNLSATKEVRVEIEVYVTKITLNKTRHTFTDSTPLQLTATVTPEEATNKDVTWESSNTNIATVDKQGKVTPKSNGESRITATAKDGSEVKATCDITVNVEGPLYKKGDINKDGKVSVMDVRYGLKALTKGTITAEEITIGDVNGDNKFSVIDARKILRYIVGKIPSLD